MKGIWCLVTVGLMLGCAATGKDFSGFQIALRDKLLANYSNRYIEADVGRLTSLSYPNVEDMQEIWVFTFDTNVSSIKAVKTSFTSEKETYSLVNNKFVLTLTDGINVDFTFNWDVYIGQMYLFAGTGMSTVQVHNLTVTQIFEADIVSTIEMEMQFKSLVINGDIIDKMFSNGVQQVIKAAFKKKLFPIIQESLSDALKEIDNLFFLKYKTLTIAKEDHTIVLTNEFRPPAVSERETEKWENLLLDSVVTIEGTECEGEILYRPDLVQVVDEGLREMFCINIEIFIAALKAEANCSLATQDVVLDEWGLGGQAVEIFELVPHLAEYYKKNESYTIKRTVSKDISINPENSHQIELIKTYDFVMTKDNNRVISIKAKFPIELTVEPPTEKRPFIFLRQSTSGAEEITITPTIDPIGKALIRRFLKYEVSYIKNHHLGLMSLPVPDPLKYYEVSFPSASRSFCIKYEDK